MHTPLDLQLMVLLQQILRHSKQNQLHTMLQLAGKILVFSTKSAAGRVMSDIFKDADAILEEQLDSMMEKFNSSDQQFYLEYKSAREIKDLGHRFDDTR